MASNDADWIHSDYCFCCLISIGCMIEADCILSCFPSIGNKCQKLAGIYLVYTVIDKRAVMCGPIPLFLELYSG